MKRCKKCDMPMENPKDYCNGDTSSDLCVHCCPVKKDTEQEPEDPSQGNLG